jgi:tetratricopeptide (TPR) repeat protein
MIPTATPSVEFVEQDASRTPERPRRYRFVGPVLAVVIAGLAVGRFLLAGDSTPSQTSSNGAAPTGEQLVDAGLELEVLRTRTTAEPESPDAWLEYGNGALRIAIASGDPSYYGVAEQALEQALDLVPDSADALASRAGLALSVHDFDLARDLATRSVAANDRNASALAALFDAHIENGDYDAAESTVQRLLDVDPGVAALARTSYFRQLTGDMDGARTAMQQALGAATTDAERATMLVFLGDIALESGRVDDAGRAYRRASELTPSSTSAAVGTARVFVARGSYDAAASILDDLILRSPLPTPALLRGEVAELQGDADAAAAAFRIVEANNQLLSSEGVATDLEAAIFSADRGDITTALELATAAYADRRTVFTADALAWATHRSGRTTDALPLIDEALSTGITAPQIRVHAAAIFLAAGDLNRARIELALAFESSPWLAPSIRPIAAETATVLGITPPKDWSL